MGEYFLIEQDTTAEGVPILDELPSNIEILEFISGRRLAQPTVNSIEISLRKSSGDFRPDMVTYLIPLFSSKLKSALIYLGVHNIDYYPVQLTDPGGFKHESDYWLANVIGLIACVDVSRSDAKYDRVLKKYKFKSFTVDETKLHGERMFRLAEKRQLLLIDQQLKEDLQRYDLRGVRIRNTREYDGY